MKKGDIEFGSERLKRWDQAKERKINADADAVII